jgi:uncharacterized protein (TIGR00369 family)
MKGESNARSRTVNWEDPVIGATAAPDMSGLDYMRAIMTGELPTAPMADLMGFGLVEVEEGRVVFDCIPAEYHYNPIGSVHGGLACTLFDSAMGCAVHTMLPVGVGYTTLELKVNLLRAITIETGCLLCEGALHKNPDSIARCCGFEQPSLNELRHRWIFVQGPARARPSMSADESPPPSPG